MTPILNHLDPSELGNKDYWETTYTSDLHTHSLNPLHTGTTWFTTSNASPLTLRYLLSLSPPLPPTTTSFLDLGTGNGSLLFHLRSHFSGPMLGIDYSPSSISLASRLSLEKGFTSSEIRFKEWDILVPPTPENGWEEGEFDVLLDKGTFDAVSLNEEMDARGRRVCEGYADKVVRMVKVGGRFLVTSCNWTEAELRGWFEGSTGNGDWDGRGFDFDGRVEYPKFRFGGREGQSVYGVCFRRVR
ncbi:MAG: hypothetical protein Q9166_005114 [cf. Caloplaca sp. 2 TL-2023]